jgi:predicted SAM-dependent methyltransferase
MQSVTFRKYIRPIKALLRRISWRFIRLVKPARHPIRADGRLLLHLGCGPIDVPGYTNIDAQPFPHVHYVHDVYPLEIFESNSVDLVYVSHVLEHFPFNELPKVLSEWRRVLRVGGILRVGVPNFEVLASIYSDTGDIRNILGPLMGGQSDRHNFHYSVFDSRYLTELLQNAGFKQVRFWDPELVEYHGFHDTTSNVWNFLGRDYPISLNMEAVK